MVFNQIYVQNSSYSTHLISKSFSIVVFTITHVKLHLCMMGLLFQGSEACDTKRDSEKNLVFFDLCGMCIDLNIYAQKITCLI